MIWSTLNFVVNKGVLKNFWFKLFVIGYFFLFIFLCIDNFVTFFASPSQQIKYFTWLEKSELYYLCSGINISMNLKFKGRSKNNFKWKNSFLDKNSLPIDGKVYNFIIKNKSWSNISKVKKHKALSHCNNFVVYQNTFRKKWNNVSGIYKITFTPFKLFFYYGSSKNLGERLKYHFYNGKYQNTFLGLLIYLYGWEKFTVSIVETCSIQSIKERENWYLKTFKPILNILTESYSNSFSLNQRNHIVSNITKYKISNALKGKTWSQESKEKRKKSISGSNHYNYGKSLPLSTLNAAALLLGKPIYVYNEKDFKLLNNKPFRSIREAVKHLPVSQATLPKKLDIGKPFKGYYYYTKPHNFEK